MENSEARTPSEAGGNCEELEEQVKNIMFRYHQSVDPEEKAKLIEELVALEPEFLEKNRRDVKISLSSD